MENSLRQKADSWLPGGGGREEWEVTAEWAQVSFVDDENVLEIDIGGDWTTL